MIQTEWKFIIIYYYSFLSITYCLYMKELFVCIQKTSLYYIVLIYFLFFFEYQTLYFLYIRNSPFFCFYLINSIILYNIIKFYVNQLQLPMDVLLCHIEYQLNLYEFDQILIFLVPLLVYIDFVPNN